MQNGIEIVKFAYLIVCNVSAWITLLTNFCITGAADNERHLACLLGIFVQSMFLFNDGDKTT